MSQCVKGYFQKTRNISATFPILVKSTNLLIQYISQTNKTNGQMSKKTKSYFSGDGWKKENGMMGFKLKKNITYFTSTLLKILHNLLEKGLLLKRR